MELNTIEKLISLIRDRPQIYGPRPKRGKKKHQRILDDLWKEVSTLMNRPVRECKLKWTTLRNCYARLLREERLHKVKKRHWHLSNHMSFLRGHIQPYNETRGKSIRQTFTRTSKSSLDSSGINNSCDENTMPSVEQPNEISNYIVKQNSTIPDSLSGEQNELLGSWTQENTTENHENEINCCPAINFNPFSLHERSTESIEDNSQTKLKQEQVEGNVLFLRSLLPDMNSLTDKKQRIFKRKVLEVLEQLFNENELEVHRGENLLSQCQISRPNYNVQVHTIMPSEKLIQKIEPNSP